MPHAKLIYSRNAWTSLHQLFDGKVLICVKENSLKKLKLCIKCASSHVEGASGQCAGAAIFYVNDLVGAVPDDVTSKLFVDDCVAYKEVISGQNNIALQETLVGINDWCAA